MIKNKKKLSKSILKILLLLIVIAFAVYYINNYFSRLKFVKYSKFGISLPVKYSIHGIDVSHYQGNIDWEVVKAMKVDQIKIGFMQNKFQYQGVHIIFLISIKVEKVRPSIL